VSALAARRDATLFAGSAYDPTAAGGLIAWQRPGGVALLRRGGEDATLPGTHPALGGGRIAWREGDAVVIADAGSLRQRDRRAAPGAGVLAVSDSLLAWRARDAAGTDRIYVQADGGEPRLLLESPAPQELGRPALRDGLLLCHVAGPAGSRLYGVDVDTGRRRVLRSQRGAMLSNPSTDGSRLLYVRATGRTQELRVGPLEPTDDDEVLLVHASPGRRDREAERGLRRHRHGPRRPQKLPPRAAPGVVDTLWSTALSSDAAYVTRLHVQLGAPRSADILSVAAAR
jgi:hypothetical protein